MMSSLQGGTVDFTAVNAGLLYGMVKDYAVLTSRICSTMKRKPTPWSTDR
jgi:hypothetical protein